MDGTQSDSSPEQQAIEFLADSRFYKTFSISPEQCRHGPPRSSPLRIAYSDLGDPEGTPLVFVGGLFGSRYTLALADKLAKERHVRLISPDKPGIGGTDPVDLQHKIGVWLDILTSLITHLSLPPISLLGHSSGVIYALNTAFRLRPLLDPHHPYIALLAPWVHPPDSYAFQSTVASSLPNWAIHRWYEATHFLARTGIKPMLGPSTARPGVEMKGEETDPLSKAVDEKVLEYALRENVEGVSQEALLCLKRGQDPKGMWGGWEDYDGFLGLLRESEGKWVGDHGGKRLMVDVYFAEEDNSSGNRGSELFDECWKANAEDIVRYKSQTAPGTTHETVMRAEFGVLEQVFRAITDPGAADK